MRTFDINRPLTSKALNEALYKNFNVKINFDKYTREQLETYRNLLRTKVSQTESQANFNDLLSNDDYQKDKFVLGVLNTRIKEMLGEAKGKCCCEEKGKTKCPVHGKAVKEEVVSEKAVSKAQQKFMGMVHATQKGEKAPSKEVAKAAKGMSKKAAKDYASTKHKGLPEKVKKTDESAKPDFLDVDKDGNKKETFKKAIADKKKNPFKKTSESAKPDFLDLDKDGNKKETMKKASQDKKKKPVKESKSELIHKAYQQFIAEGIANYIAEDEEGKAKSITAAADMVNDFTSWMQRVGNYQTKSMIELADNIRANFGMQEAETFKQTVGQALEGALNSLTAAREEINNAVAVLAGEAPAAEPMGAEPDMGEPDMATDLAPDLEPADADELNVGADEFAASDAAAGGPETTGRMKRESIERGNRLMRILGA